jgi:Fe-S cluster assembly protein SufD
VTSETNTGVATPSAAQQLEADFQSLAEATNGAPGWLQEHRRAGMARFRHAGFPTTRHEAWRFTDVKAIAHTPFALARPPADGAVTPEAVREFVVPGVQPLVAVFVNGRFAPRLSSLGELPAEVRVGSLEDASRQVPAVVERHLGRYASIEGNPFTALNAGFTRDGAFVLVPRNVVVAAPIQLLFVSDPLGGGSFVTHPRSLIVVEPGAQVSLVESYVGAGDGPYWTNAVTETVVGENARVDAYRVQREGPNGFHTATAQTYQARSSVYSCITFAFGGTLTRHDLGAVLDGEGAEATLDGLSVLGDRQHVDVHTTLDHAKPHCTSWEFFNGVFDGRARGVFNGRIIVREGAQKTDSKQTNNNLLLSRQARADSQPQLEIYADDVKCTHGATLGPIDDQQVFYLQSRGLDAAAARSLLTYGFAAEILSNVRLDALRDAMDRLVRARLG